MAKKNQYYAYLGNKENETNWMLVSIMSNSPTDRLDEPILVAPAAGGRVATAVSGQLFKRKSDLKKFIKYMDGSAKHFTEEFFARKKVFEEYYKKEEK